MQLTDPLGIGPNPSVETVVRRGLEMFDVLPPNVRDALRNSRACVNPWLPYRMIFFAGMSNDDVIAAIEKVVDDWCKQNPLCPEALSVGN